MVLTTRISQYCEAIRFNSFLNGLTLDSPAISDMIHYPRRVGICQTLADYSAISLGYVQLASLCELAIVMRFSIYHKRYEDLRILRRDLPTRTASMDELSAFSQ